MRPLILRRRGTALFLALVVCAGFAVLAIAASERMFGMKKLTGLELGKQRAGAAAEAVAAMVESRLMDAAADYTKLVIPVDADATEPTNPWWGLKGCVYKGADGAMHGPGHDADAEPLWMNGCLVRWSVEPLRVYSEAWSNQPSGSDDLQYVVNPPRDPSDVNDWESKATKGPDGTTVPGSHNRNVADFYHFRVVAQAYALKDPADTTAEPWQTSGHHTAAAQSLRVLQIQSLQLFKYALFYASPSPIGDLDFQTGGTIWVQKGAVHSNGAIYIRGGESTGFSNKNWHVMASGDGGVDAPSAGQNIFLGEEQRPITITGVAGIFRLNKTGNNLAANHDLVYSAAGHEVALDPLRPMDIPTDATRFLRDDLGGGSRVDLNGDQVVSNRHRFNGKNFTRANDSRSPQEFVKAFSNYARDANNGATTVRTLQNIPELGGRPFEPQALAAGLNQRFLIGSARKNPLYGFAGSPLSNPSRNVGGGRERLYYVADPTGVPGGLSAIARGYNKTVAVTVAPNAWPVFSDEMKLWWSDDFKKNDVLNPSKEVALRDQIPATAIDTGDGAAYTLGATKADRELPVWFDDDFVTLKGGTPGNAGIVSFPGVPFTLPAAFGGAPWNPQFYGTGFSPREVKGHYLEAALFGNLAQNGAASQQQRYYIDSAALAALPAAPTSIAQTGIVIRERRWQQRPRLATLSVDGAGPSDESENAWNNYWPGAGVPGTPTVLPLNTLNAGVLTVNPITRPDFDATPSNDQKRAYLQYLCSQYTVLFCGRNITAPFFGQILSQTDARDFIVTEDEFVDPRESGYMWGLYGATGNTSGDWPGPLPTNDFYQYHFFLAPQTSTVPGGGMVSRDYRQNVLTIHMRAFQEWLRSTTMSELGYRNTSAAADTANKHFTGVVYCHRTRRSDTLHPLLTPELEWPGFTHVTNNVETTPTRLVDQSHYRAYWFEETASSVSPRPLPANYPPINFPWNWREPSGSLETTRCATRLKGQTSDAAETDASYYRVYWNHASPTSVDALGTSAFTYITPQRFYLWGNFCYRVNSITSESDGRTEIDGNINNITPCAVFADNYTMQSVNWRDENSQSLPTTPFGTPPGLAGSTCHFISMVINNSPNARWNCGSFGAAGQEGTFRMMEDWGYGATHFWWSGSQVVMNMGRYHHSGHNHLPRARSVARNEAPAHMGVGAFHTSTNHYIFNTNLFKREGRPPLSPSGVDATRVVNQVTYFGD